LLGSRGSLAFSAILALGGYVAACGSGKDVGPSCQPGAAGVDKGGSFAPSLDAYCMVSVDGGAVIPSAGVTPYDVNTPLFSDYAAKYRTVWLPPSTSVTYNAQGRFAGRYGDHEIVRVPGRLPRRQRAGEVDRDARARAGHQRLDGIELHLR
jgi:hypothetical protein